MAAAEDLHRQVHTTSLTLVLSIYWKGATPESGLIGNPKRKEQHKRKGTPWVEESARTCTPKVQLQKPREVAAMSFAPVTESGKRER